MKTKIAFIFVAVLSALTFTSNALALRVVTTFTVLADITKNIAGSYAQVESLTPIGAEIHEYEPTSRDLVALNRSDLIITNGLGVEKWFERFYQRAKKIPVVVASEGVEPSLINEGPYAGKPNPHGWMSLTNAYIYVQNITAALVKYDPANKAGYEANAKAYIEKLNKMENDVRTFISKNNLSGVYLITSESAFSYLARDIGLRYDSIWPVNAEDVGTPAQITRIINLVRDNGIKVVFSGSTMDIKPMQVIMKETGAQFGGYLYVDTLTDVDGPVPTYLDMLQKTVYTIVDGYNKTLTK
ncbi:metal ABC transporter solute-binding protein, Zn/Mn family [Psittacicella gerlachiana]|uniref:Metal ABC transporter substrate-binding protein n=1 Tax=Psittacicella gerlachiana TaxID=2028574 RepID=A0A3A1YKD0_9GAMM|nr:zinc ABC transporter substrate-binding protein [Psittacicella gerlachiana]RIY37926.1 metal ABC transporter substrate-binding protein [Psittacicella gerlachiana]